MEFDAVVVGSGPNGLAAAIEVARAGCLVCVVEAHEVIGGGSRSAELTLPGFIHDVCSAIHPLAFASPFFRSLPLAEHGLAWIHPPAALAHPFDDGTAAVLEKSIESTSATLGEDARAYSNCFAPLAQNADKLVSELLGPPVHVPRHPLSLAAFGLQAIQSAVGFSGRHFKGPRARGLFAGVAAHSNIPLERAPSAAFGLLLGMLGHTGGWPIAKGGSQKISAALSGYFKSLGGQIVTGSRVKSFHDIPPARAVFFDVAPLELLRITGDRLPASYRHQLEQYKHGPGVFKIDWALKAPVPWKNPDCARAGTLHLGGTLEEIAAAEAATGEGRIPDPPFVLFAQQSLFDPTRAPAGKHTAWGYCHVPRGSSIDMTKPIEAQVERFAPGFRDCIIGRHTISTSQFESYNPNYIGGDISGGLHTLWQILARPSLRISPYTTPMKSVFLCSSSTPPGGGVHGMCGYHAARAALRSILYNLGNSRRTV